MEPEKENKEDIVAFDVPLFIRLLEFAREDATDDETLHKITDNIELDKNLILKNVFSLKRI